MLQVPDVLLSDMMLIDVRRWIVELDERREPTGKKHKVATRR
jgi:hypothetical protein